MARQREVLVSLPYDGGTAGVFRDSEGIWLTAMYGSGVGDSVATLPDEARVAARGLESQQRSRAKQVAQANHEGGSQAAELAVVGALRPG